MTTVPTLGAPGPERRVPDHRGSPVPTAAMIATRWMELRKRRGLMVALVLVNIGIPTIFLVVRLVAHGVAPKSYGPAGGYDIFTNLVAGVMFVFGFIVAATLGCTAGSIDLSEGMFRHLVVTGRSRVALYFARIPAGLGIVLPLVAIGFTVVCTICCVAAPKSINFDGATVPASLTRSGFQTWAGDHPLAVVCNLPFSGQTSVNLPCAVGPGGPAGPGGVIVRKGARGAPAVASTPTTAQLKALAIRVAAENYQGYTQLFLSPPVGLMVRSGLWLELEAAIGFLVGLGLGSLLGQRTVAVILMVVLEVILTPILSRTSIPHMINLQRAVVGLATAHLEPAGMPIAFGGHGGGGNANALLVPESRTVAVLVIVAWLVGWTAIGAWRMARRDA